MLLWKPSEIASDNGISRYKGGVLGSSFQLAITAPLYSIIGYCIVPTQGYLSILRMGLKHQMVIECFKKNIFLNNNKMFRIVNQIGTKIAGSEE